jgi:alpha-tubulin suppressor-like RCC1 family protein
MPGEQLLRMRLSCTDIMICHHDDVSPPQPPFLSVSSIQGGATATQAGIAVTFEGRVYGWGNNYMGVMALAPKVVRTPTMLPIPCPVSRALLGMSGQQVLNQSVDGSQMVRPCGE